MGARLLEDLNNQNENYIFPFLWLHGEDEDTLRKYMQVIYEANCRAVCVESRPHPDFLGEKWWKDMDVIIEEAKKRSMKVWILDDSHFPTGFCNGQVLKAPLEQRRQSVFCKSFDVKNKRTFSCNLTKVYKDIPKTFMGNMVARSYNKGIVFDDDSVLSVTMQTEEKTDPVLVEAREENGRLKVSGLPERATKLFVTFLTRNAGIHRSYMNMLEPDSCRILLDTVYEPHYAHYKDEFGTTIAGFFSDEPELGNGVYFNDDITVGQPFDLPWSKTLEERLPEMLGENWKEKMPLLWNQGTEEETARVRFLYMDAVTKLVEESFSKQVGSWCMEHGVKYIGHIIEDNNAHARTGVSLGHYFRGLAGQHMAGIDDIGGQVLPFKEDAPAEGIFKLTGGRDGEFYHFALGKLAASAAALDPAKNGDSMCEIFGNYGWKEGTGMEKYLADHFMVQAVNHFVPHAFSPKSYPDKDCPPHFYANGNNPQYRAFGELMGYMNRICHLLSGARPAVDTAILYHGELEWAGNTMLMQKPARIFMENQRDFLFLPCDVFAEDNAYNCRITDEGLLVNGICFKKLFIPECDYIPEKLADALEKLNNSGCDVLFINQLPKGIAEIGSRGNTQPEVKEAVQTGQQEEAAEAQSENKTEKWMEILAKQKVISLSEICRETEPLASVEPANKRIRLSVFKGDTDFVYLVNEDENSFTGTVTVTYKEAVIYDPWSNTVSDIPPAGDSRNMSEPGVQESDMQESGTQIPVYLRSQDAVLIISKESQGAAETADCRVSSRSLAEELKRAGDSCWKKSAFLHNWQRSVTRAINYPKFGRQESVRQFEDYGKTDRKFSGFIAYENEFEAHEGERLILEITDAGEAVEVFVNGISLGIEIVQPIYYDLTEAVKKGKNTLRIEVATTLERENGAKLKKSRPTGIYGEVSLYKISSAVEHL